MMVGVAAARVLDLGLWVGGAYAVQQVGRTVFMVVALRAPAGSQLPAAHWRASGRRAWAGRAPDWTIEDGHFAERCQVFILIALGESIVIVGATLTSRPVSATDVAARSADLGRLGRSAYHLIHPVMVAGIIVAAAADQKVLSDPAVAASTASAWMILGGPALFLAGHAAFKLVVWRYLSWPRVGGMAVLALLCLAARATPELGLAACAAGVVAEVAASDRVPGLHPPD